MPLRNGPIIEPWKHPFSSARGSEAQSRTTSTLVVDSRWSRRVDYVCFLGNGSKDCRCRKVATFVNCVNVRPMSVAMSVSVQKHVIFEMSVFVSVFWHASCKISVSVIWKVGSVRVRVRLWTRFIATCPCPWYEILRMSVSVKNVRVKPYHLSTISMYVSSGAKLYTRNHLSTISMYVSSGAKLYT